MFTCKEYFTVINYIRAYIVEYIYDNKALKKVLRNSKGLKASIRMAGTDDFNVYIEKSDFLYMMSQQPYKFGYRIYDNIIDIELDPNYNN